MQDFSNGLFRPQRNPVAQRNFPPQREHIMLLTLQTCDRTSDRQNSTILIVATHRGKRYPVSMLGDGSEWGRNVCAADGKATSSAVGYSRFAHGSSAQRARPDTQGMGTGCIRGRRHLPASHDALGSDFDAIADGHPVFRVKEAE